MLPMREMASNFAAAAVEVARPGAPGAPEKGVRPAPLRRKQGKIDYDAKIARKNRR